LCSGEVCYLKFLGSCVLLREPVCDYRFHASSPLATMSSEILTLAPITTLNTMKKYLFTLIAVLGFVIVQGQTITNSSYSTTGHIKSDGTIQNSSYSTKGHIKSDGTITDASYKTIGHIKSDGTIQDASYRTVGHVKDDGTVQNASYSTIGHIKDDGTVQNASYSTIGHASGVKKEWAAVVFFFFKFD
jgi:hypothetical protein